MQSVSGNDSNDSNSRDNGSDLVIVVLMVGIVIITLNGSIYNNLGKFLYLILTENWADAITLTAEMMLTSNSISETFPEHSEHM